ncbi:hypothetical protein GPECTOR_82g256 [Gonium pectorale]|uniref:Right handed beta helix domain-containing protein n=1 Tax=Gonium pectorale TaxID=33097 RepID=A0A150G1H6_GONPE|nr:hypothetical protein GPECTOR_82g256 [Gonium pectorale]|eukprot:KXZ43722.1 hypothetical protein GPECTOR_82g256 [Gonium pectorale]
MITSVYYRVVYEYPDGSRSCPAAGTVLSKAYYGVGEVYLELALPPTVRSMPGAPVAVVQRKGQLYQDEDRVGPSATGWDGEALQPAGPSVAGWRWAFGFSGVTDNYRPSTFPGLTVTFTLTGRDGINATYQLVYELEGGYYSYPSSSRFVVAHNYATSPLVLLPSPATSAGLTTVPVTTTAAATGTAPASAAAAPRLPAAAVSTDPTVRLTLVDSVVMDVSLSPYGPLIECRECGELVVVNSTLRGLAAPPLPPTYNVHGAVAASGLSRVNLTGLSCSGVRGAHGWACLLLEFKASAAGIVTMTRCRFSSNSVAQAAGVFSSSTEALQRLLRLPIAGLNSTGNGTGAVALTSRTTSASSLSVRIEASSMTGNEGGSGAALFSSTPLDSLEVWSSNITDNLAARNGGAVHLASNVTRLYVFDSSSIDRNTAGGSGGAFYVAGAVASLAVAYGSSVSDNTAVTGGGGGVCTGLWAGAVSILDRSVADRNSAAGEGGFFMGDAVLAYTSTGTDIRISGRCSVSGNRAIHGGGFSAYYVKTIRVSDFSRVDKNSAVDRGGAFMSPFVDFWRPQDRNWTSVRISGFSSVSFNNASIGGGIFVPDVLRLGSFVVANNSHFDNNTAQLTPGGIKTYAVGTVLVTGNSTMSYNRGMNVRPSYELGGGAVFAATMDQFVVDGGSAVVGNRLMGGGDGGAVKVEGLLKGLKVEGRGTVVSENGVALGHGGFASAGSIGLLRMDDGARVTLNEASKGHGGAVSVDTTLDILAVSGGVISNNSAMLEGGGVYVGTDLVDGLHMEAGGIAEGNSARIGGFLFVGRAALGPLLVNDSSRLCNNRAGLSGGAILVQEAAYGGFYVTGNATACFNVAEAGDGGVLDSGYTVSFVHVSLGGSLVGNRAARYGGAVSMTGQLPMLNVTLGGRVEDNRAGSSGGVIYADFISAIELTHGAAAVRNKAGGDGGLAFAPRIGKLAVNDSELTGNGAGRSGGVVAALTALDSLVIDNANLSFNRAERGSGGVLSVAVPRPGSEALQQVAPEELVYRISGGSVMHGNTAYLDGGALSIAAEPPTNPTDAINNKDGVNLTIHVSDTRFSSNFASGAGGALSVSAPSAGALRVSSLLTNCTFFGNVAGSSVFRIGSSISSGYGGAVSFVSAPKYRADAVMMPVLELLLGDEVDQTAAAPSASAAASGSSASASLDSACSLRVERSRFEGNRCQMSGGALAAVSCPTVVTDSGFLNNVARVMGGGMAAILEPVEQRSVMSPDTSSSSESPAAPSRHRRGLQQQQQDGDATPSPDGVDAAVASRVAAAADSLWLDVRGSNFTANAALWDCGGGLYSEVAVGAGTRVASSLFHSNEARDFHGGGACILSQGADGVALFVNGTRFVNNTATRQGGGLHSQMSSATGNLLWVDSVELAGNRALQGGGLVAFMAPGSTAALGRVDVLNNTALDSGGGVYVLCSAAVAAAAAAAGTGESAVLTSALTCGIEPILTLQACNLTANKAEAGSGGGLFVSAGAAVTVDASRITGNEAGKHGGGVSASGCMRLTVSNGSLTNNTATLGGGVFTQSCERVSLSDTELVGNEAVTGGGAFLAGPSDDTVTVPSASLASASAAVVLSRALFGHNWARTSSDRYPTTAAEAVQQCVSSYQRFDSLGGGAFLFGNVSVLVSESDLRGNNSALAGVALGSAQRCASPAAGNISLASLADPEANLDAEAQWAALQAPAALGCWPLLLNRSRLPASEATPLWLQDSDASPLHARCDGRPPSAGVATTADSVVSTACEALGPAVQRACALSWTLAACAVEDADRNLTVAELAQGQVEVAPTHMRLESSLDAVRPGTALNVTVRLYNGLNLPVREDILPFTVTVSIEPADPSAGSGPSNSSAHLSPRPQRPWQDATVANLAVPSDSSLTATVLDGYAVWPYLTVRGWPGRYTLVFTARATEDLSLYPIEPLRVGIEVMRCETGEGLDSSWSRQPGAKPSWLACSRCARGRFTLWQDNRPSLWEVDRTDYLTFFLAWARAATEGEATCMSCPEHGACQGGPVLVPNPGYWHSAVDSALFHRCPQQEACGLSSSYTSWARLPDVNVTALTAVLTSTGSVLLLNGSGTEAALPPGSGTPRISWQVTSPSGPLEARSGWLALCSQMGYMAASRSLHASNFLDGSSNNTSITTASSNRMVTAAWISSLDELAASCAAWGVAAGGGGGDAAYLQLQCSQGYTSRLCAACQPGYFINAEFECRTCPSLRNNIVLALLSLFGAIALVLYTSITNLKENYAVTHDGTSVVDDEEAPSDFLKVAIVHAQFYIIITRLPVAYPDVISRMQAFVGAATGAESAVAFSYGCMFPWEESGGQASAQLLGALLVPCVVVAICLTGWALRYLFYNRARMRRSTNLRHRRMASRLSTFAEAALASVQPLTATISARLAVSVRLTSSLAYRTSGSGVAGGTATTSSGQGHTSLHTCERDGKGPDLPPKAAGGGGDCDGSHGADDGEADKQQQRTGLQIQSMCTHQVVEPGAASPPELIPVPPFVSERHGSATSLRLAPPPPAAGLPMVESGGATPRTPNSIAKGKRGFKEVLSSLRQQASERFNNSTLTKILIRLDDTLGLWQQLGIVLMLAVFILYPGWAQAALSVFACYHIDDGTSGPFTAKQKATWSNGYWIRDMEQECYSGRHLTFYVPIGIASVVLLCGIPPLASFVLLWRNRRDLDDPGVKQRYGFLYARYKRTYFWWESVLMLEELALVAVEVFGRALEVVSHQILLMLAAFIVLSLINMACAPARSRLIVLLEFLSMGVLSLTVTLSLYFVVGDELGSASATVVGLVILLINVLLLAGFLALLLRLKWKQWGRSATMAKKLKQRIRTWVGFSRAGETPRNALNE